MVKEKTSGASRAQREHVLRKPRLEEVNGTLIRKLGSLHASEPAHYSSLIGRLLLVMHNVTLADIVIFKNTDIVPMSKMADSHITFFVDIKLSHPYLL